MIFTSPIIAAGSGSIAGITFSHNKGGGYVRNRSIPTNPGSSFQTTVRNALSQLVTRWVETLSLVQRTAWETYAANVTLVNALGQAINVTGLNMYTRSNVPRVQVGLPIVDDAPGIFDLGTLTPPALSAASPDVLTLAFTNTDDWADTADSALLLFTSRPQNASINYFKGPYRFVGRVNGAGTPPTSPAGFTSPFELAVGQKVFAQLRVTRADGRLTTPFPVFDNVNI